jgi:5-hydroxyisourate hydrolase
MSPITTHILDLAHGRPAPGVAVILEQRAAGDDLWTELARGRTNADGRLTDLLPDDAGLAPGVYRLRFDTGAYFAAAGVAGFYPEVAVMVHIDDPAGHYHLPLLLSPFGYSTYRGS